LKGDFGRFYSRRLRPELDNSDRRGDVSRGKRGFAFHSPAIRPIAAELIRERPAEAANEIISTAPAQLRDKLF